MTGASIETPRLTMRPPVLADLDGWAALMADPEAARFIGGVKSRAESWQGMASTAGHWTLKGFGLFSVIEKASGRWIGRVGPLQPEGWPGPEVGWGILREHWGKGYATESAAAAMDWAFDTLGWQEAIHCIDPANAASIAVAGRLGSTRRGSGRLPPPWHEVEIDLWGQTRDEWRARGAGT